MSDKKPKLYQLSKQERKELVEKIHIDSPRTKKIRKLIEHCQEHSKISAEPECILLSGEPGNGKTTECKMYARRYPSKVEDGKTILPVLYVSIPSPTTTKSLPEKLLKEIGDPFWDRGKTTIQTLRLIDLLDALQTELIIMDEFQGFIDGKTDRAVLEISNWLKDFINGLQKPVVLAGLPYCDIVLKANDQLDRRFPIRETLHPFGWNDLRDRENFREFLKKVDEMLPFEARSNLADQHIAHRIFVATNGVIDFVMKIVRRAAELAIDKDIEKIDLSLLARAYKDRVKAIISSKGCTEESAAGRPNPFIVAEEELEIKPFPKSMLGIMATNRRSKKKIEEMSLTEAFSRS
jgi:hypothetical protein